MWVNQFIRTKSIFVSIDDTHPTFYQNEDVIEVNENIDTVIKYIIDEPLAHNSKKDD